MVHKYTGDFEEACKVNKVSDQCWPSDLAITEKVESVLSTDKQMGVYLATDEENNQYLSDKGYVKFIDELIPLANQTLSTLNDSDINGEIKSYFKRFPLGLDPFAMTIIDYILLSVSDTFIGNRYSTISRHVTKWRKHWKAKLNYTLTSTYL